MSSGFSFGSKPGFGSSLQQQQQPLTGFGFGTNPSTQTTTPSLFGTAPASTTPSLFSNTSTLFATPATSTATPALSFGASKGFGLQSTANTSLPFGQSITTTPGTSAPTLGISFGTIASSAPPTFGFNTAVTTTSGGLTFNLGGTSTTSTTVAGVNFGFGATTTNTGLKTSTTTSVPVGLGGVATTNQTKSTTVNTQKEVPPKDQPLPNEILQTVEAFKEMVKQQKQHSSDIARCSVREFRRVEQEIDQLSNQLSEVENQLQKNRHLAEKLKYDTAKTVQNVEMAQRTHDIPPGLQYENSAPLKFFLNLAEQFERDMQNLKLQIEAADKYVKNNKNPDSLTPQDLSMGMRRIHETFVALAGRLQSVHSQVESQKEMYLNIRRHIFQDTSNTFDKLTKSVQFQVSNQQNTFIHSPPKVATGPTPFNNLTIRNMNTGSQQHTTPPPGYSGPSTSTGTGFTASGFGTAIGGTQPSNLLFGSTSFGQTSFNSSFQLQKPPTSNKRGKV